jgi:hypothetical protein
MTTASINFKKTVDPAVEAEISVKALRLLGVEYNQGTLARQFAELLTQDCYPGVQNEGRLFVRVPKSVSTDKMIEVINTLAKTKGVDPVRLWNPLWVPGSEKESLTEVELNGSVEAAEPRLALFNAESTGCDPLLFLTGVPFDEKYRRNAVEATMVELIDEKVRAFRSVYHHSFGVNGFRDYLFWYMQELIRDIDPRSDEFVLNRGWMADPNLGRHAVGGGSYVAFVISLDGQASLYRWDGYAVSNIGVSFSVGLGKN